MNGFRKMQERLLEEGWYVGWNLPCCQSCAWGELPYEFEDGTEVDFAKVLFNHSQDCELYIEGEECERCEGEGYIELDEDADEDADDTCSECRGMGEIPDEWPDEADLDTSVSGFTCLTPEAQHYSTFCFDGSKEGVKNLKEILPIIEECGCKWHWDQTGKTRIEISW